MVIWVCGVEILNESSLLFRCLVSIYLLVAPPVFFLFLFLSFFFFPPFVAAILYHLVRYYISSDYGVFFFLLHGFGSGSGSGFVSDT